MIAATRPGIAPRLTDIEWMAFDLETTGFGPGTRPVEFGAVVFRIGPYEVIEFVDSFQLMVDPGIPIPEGASKIHGITAETLALALEAGTAMPLDGPGWEAWCAFVQKHPRAIGLAHNARDFDLPILMEEIRRQGVSLAGLPHPPAVVDSLILARYLRGRNGNKLVELAARYGIEAPAHRAHMDCLTLVKVFVAMLIENSERFQTFLDLEVTGAVVR